MAKLKERLKVIPPKGYVTFFGAMSILLIDAKDPLKLAKHLPFRLKPRKPKCAIIRIFWKKNGKKRKRIERDAKRYLSKNEVEVAQRLLKSFHDCAELLGIAVGNKKIAIKLGHKAGLKKQSDLPADLVRSQWKEITETGRIKWKKSETSETLITVYFRDKDIWRIAKGAPSRVPLKDTSLTPTESAAVAEKIVAKAFHSAKREGLRLAKAEFQTILDFLLPKYGGDMVRTEFENTVWFDEWCAKNKIVKLSGKQRRSRKVIAGAFVDKFVANFKTEDLLATQ